MTCFGFPIYTDLQQAEILYTSEIESKNNNSKYHVELQWFLKPLLCSKTTHIIWMSIESSLVCVYIKITQFIVIYLM